MSSSSSLDRTSLIESLSLSLVREYLAKKKYRRTLDTLSEELPSKPEPTTTSAIVRQLGIQRLVQKNTKVEQPLTTLLEICAEYMYGKYGKEENGNGESTSSKSNTNTTTTTSGSTKSSTRTTTNDQDDELNRSMARLGRTNSLTNTTTPTISSNVSSSRPSSLATSAGVSSKSRLTSTTSSSPSHHSSPIIRTTNERDNRTSSFSYDRTASSTNNNVSSSRESSSRDSTSTNTNTSSVIGSLNFGSVRPSSASRTGRSPPRSSSSSSSNSTKVSSSSTNRLGGGGRDNSDLMVEEDIDFDEEIESYESHSTISKAPSSYGTSSSTSSSNVAFPTTPVPPATNLSLDQAHRAKSLIFGSSHLTGTFTDPWLSQGFYFKGPSETSKVPTLACGLVQSQGGPCGILAVVQAYVLKELLYGGEKVSATSAERYRILSQPPSETVLKHALIDALTEIVWGIGSEKRKARVCIRNPTIAIVRNTSSKRMPDGSIFKTDGVSEALQMFELTTKECVRNIFTIYHSMFTEERGFGCVLLLYTLIFTRGISAIESDRDEQSSLIGAHSYCTQELVNLALIGRARSNVFDGTKDLGGMILRGIDERSNIGFLSLFEHYENLEVGSYLKQPFFPIWVICSESHYTVLWSLEMKAIEQQPPGNGIFDLMYYDELGNQKEEIRLTIDTTKRTPAPRDGDLEPPLNECIRTKWGKNARIDWNGVEPIL